MWARVWNDAIADDATDEAVRLAVVVGLVRTSRARRAELLELTTSSVRRRVLTVRHGKRRALARYPVDDDLHAVLTRWAPRRRQLVAAMEGGTHTALLVTVHHTRWRGTDGPVMKLPGLPLDAQGLLLTWKRFAARINEERAGEFGWVPLPARFEQVRSAWR